MTKYTSQTVAAMHTTSANGYYNYIGIIYNTYIMLITIISEKAVRYIIKIYSKEQMQHVASLSVFVHESDVNINCKKKEGDTRVVFKVVSPYINA